MKKKNKSVLKKKYKTRIGATIKKEDIQEVAEFICEHCNGMSPREILKEIRKHPEHVINDYLEWDDERAGIEYRIQQIRNIANHILVEVYLEGNPEPQEIRATFSVIENPKDGFDTFQDRIYVNLETAQDNEFYKKQIVLKAKQELVSWSNRYKVYEELFPAVIFIEEFIPKEEKKKRK